MLETLSLVQLVAQYDPLLWSHIERVWKHAEIQNEFIGILASTVWKKLVCDIKQNKYTGFLLNSTPDLAHHERLSEVIRYIDFVNKKVELEVISQIYGNHAKDAASIEDLIVKGLETDGISLQDCRSQCYDNAATISGKISGVQQRILAKNHFLIFFNFFKYTIVMIANLFNERSFLADKWKILSCW